MAEQQFFKVSMLKLEIVINFFKAHIRIQQDALRIMKSAMMQLKPQPFIAKIIQ